MIFGRLLILPAAVAALVTLLTLSYALAATATPPVIVSGTSPYASCTDGGPGTVYGNAEVEPHIAVNPANPNNVIGVWQQDRWDDGGARGLVAGYSFDGGASWTRTTLPFSSCAPGGLNYPRASDPWVSFGPDGTAYTVSLSVNLATNANAIAAATSSDGGATWTNLKVIMADTSLKFFNDKESVTADPVNAGTAYVVWDRLQSPSENPMSNLRARAFAGPTYFSKTTDGGQSWSTPKVIVQTPSRQQTIGNHIVVDSRNGTLYNFFGMFAPPYNLSAFKVAFVKSTDGGDSWSKPQVISTFESVGVRAPNTGAEIRTGDILPEAAVDPVSGRLYVVWQDSRFSGHSYDEIAFSTSSDEGATWSAPTRINTPSGKPAFIPMVSVTPQGKVGVTYYDFRNLTNETSTLPTDYWFLSSLDNGASFGNEVHVAGPFDMFTAPNARGYFVGDYEGLAASGESFKSLFVASNSGNSANRTDVFVSTLTP